MITFPNAMLIRTAVDNLGAREYRRIKMRLGVTYDTPPDKLESFIEGIRELVRRHPYTRKEYYHVYFNSFGDSGLEVLLYCFVRTPDWATELRERHRLLIDILRLANELSVEFAFPTRTLHMVQGEMPEHGETAPDLKTAWRTGQGKAGEIVDQFTGRRIPPPVQIGQRPDEALDDGE
jgi:MscS family membrane protein